MQKGGDRMKHSWAYCSLCDTMMVRCGTCGNNTCNATYGTVGGGKTCPDCESAYAEWYSKEVSLPSDRLQQLFDFFQDREKQRPQGLCCGTQVVYLPPEAKQNIYHPLARFGFIVMTEDKIAACIFWKPNQELLRTTEHLETEDNLELIPFKYLFHIMPVQNSIMNMWLKERGLYS
jgi:hypothetical protein